MLLKRRPISIVKEKTNELNRSYSVEPPNVYCKAIYIACYLYTHVINKDPVSGVGRKDSGDQ